MQQRARRSAQPLGDKRSERMSSRCHRISTAYLWWSVGSLALPCVWLVYAYLQPSCAEHFVSWYSDCRQSQRGKLLFWWPIVTTGSIILISLMNNLNRVRSNGQPILIAWVRYLGAVVLGVGVWICLFFLSVLLTKLRFASQFGGEAAGWAFVVIWGGFAAALIVSIPIAALAFAFGHQQWKADPALVELRWQQDQAQTLERMRKRRHW